MGWLIKYLSASIFNDLRSFECLVNAYFRVNKAPKDKKLRFSCLSGSTKQPEHPLSACLVQQKYVNVSLKIVLMFNLLLSWL